MDYKKEYEQAFERAKGIYNETIVPTPTAKGTCEYIFPKLKDEEDERIRKELIHFFKNHMNSVYEEISDNNVVITWLEKQGKNEEINEASYRVGIKRVLDNPESYGLEKQGEQKPVDKVEPKFKVGDWIINSEGTLRHILAVGRTGYETNEGWLTHDIYENGFHLWTIQDAKDGDVLAAHECLVLFKEINGLNIQCYCTYHFMNNQMFYVDTLQNKTAFCPATKEQCDLLFSKMKEAGYEWDSEKKELRKIEQKPEINDNVLSRFAFYQYDNDTIYLSSVFVEECNRKRGYGSKILKAAEEVAKTFGVSKIRLKVERNTWMEEWYKKNGYEYLSPDGEYNWLEKRVDNLEPMFNVGDWVVCCNYEPEQIIGIRNHMYEMSNGDIRPINMINNNHNIRLWSIKDAKDGDVLAASDDSILIFKEVVDCGCKHYIALEKDSETINVNDNLKHFWEAASGVKPATKKQRNLLFYKMKEAGYEWDSEKKELKKIETNPTWCEEDEEMIKGLNNCLSELEEKCGWQYTYVNNKDVELDKIRNWLKFLKDRVQPQPKQEWSDEDENYKNALISLINEIKKQPLTRLEDWDGYIDWLKSLKNSVKLQPKLEWSKEDEKILGMCIDSASGYFYSPKDKQYMKDWLRNLKGRIVPQPQPKQEWSEEDDMMFLNIIDDIQYVSENCYSKSLCDEEITWLKTLKERYTWKPTDEQIKALLKLEEMHVLEHEKNQDNAHLYMVIKSLKEQLFKLKGE